jgi:Fic family protein
MHKIAVGYQAICEQLKLATLPHYRESYIAMHGRGKTVIENNHEIHVYPKTYALKNHQDLLENLEFAIKHEGINFEIIKHLFTSINKSQITNHIKQQPTGIYSRKIWYIYEFLMQDKLNLPDSKKIKYIDLLDTELYFTCNGKKSPRHGINDNLLGNHEYCPFVRRTTTLEKLIHLRLDSEAKKIVDKYDSSLIARACNYLYTKETMSSFEIEKERPSKSRVARFINLLQKAGRIDHLSKNMLIELQNSIVDPRYCDSDYRISQNYVGENIRPDYPHIHYISPKPSDVSELMKGLIDSLNRMESSQVNPVIIATCIAFGFVFIHPFEDGNGRIHRFLIHQILSKTGFSPKDIIIPVSAIMLKYNHEYDAVLESFSKPLLTVLTAYDLSDEGILSVTQDSKIYYQYLDYTKITEYLFQCVQKAIHEHMEQEIIFLLNYDKTKNVIQSIVDLPDKEIDLLIKLITQNHGELSKKKRNDYFSRLKDDEIKQLIACIQKNMMGR